MNIHVKTLALIFMCSSMVMVFQAMEPPKQGSLAGAMIAAVYLPKLRAVLLKTDNPNQALKEIRDKIANPQLQLTPQLQAFLLEQNLADQQGGLTVPEILKVLVNPAMVEKLGLLPAS